MSSSSSNCGADSADSKPKTLVLCFDGTTNEFDGNNTNVVKFFSLLKKDDCNEQLCYYQPGIGTFFKPGVVTPLFQWWAKILDEAVAWYLDEHVMGGYQFLMQNYRVGDKICLFGFSRGAYTARALGGMLYKVGLLPRDNFEQIAFAYKLYTREDKTGIELSAGFKRTFSQDVKVEFVGVWDTVSSVGVVMGRTLPFTNSNTAIKTFRHALSLDEHRVKFRPNHYHRPAPTAAAARADPEHASSAAPLSPASEASVKSDKRKLISPLPKNFNIFGPKTHKINGNVPSKAPEDKEEPTDVLEVWFSGCHTDIGGGSVADDIEISLSEITLRWMVRQVMASQCGIQFEDGALARALVPKTTFPPGTATVAGCEELKLDQPDAIAPLHDQLKILPLWWLLEIIPMDYSWQDEAGAWHKSFGFHLGKGRLIRDLKPNFHITVKERIADAPLKYKPKAIWTAGTERYVE